MTGPTPARPLVLTADPRIREELERVCAAAGVAPEVAAEPGDVRHQWSRASCVLAGDDLVPALIVAGLPDRSGLVLVTQSALISTWQRAVEMRAEAVVELPAERPRLADFLAERSRSGQARPARVVGLLGVRGGVGTSTTAATLGLVAAAAGRAVTLIDADPESSGLDLLLGCESAPGLRWSDVAAVNGRVGAEALRSSLPTTQGMPVLTWGLDASRIDLPAGTLVAMVTAASRGSDLVLVDLGRRLDDEADALLGHLDVVLLVCAGDLLSVAGTNRWAGRLRPNCPDLRLIVREGLVRGVDPDQLASAVGLRVAAVTRHTGRADRAINDGLGPVLRSRDRRTLRRLADALIEPAVR